MVVSAGCAEDYACMPAFLEWETTYMLSNPRRKAEFSHAKQHWPPRCCKAKSPLSCHRSLLAPGYVVVFRCRFLCSQLTFQGTLKGSLLLKDSSNIGLCAVGLLSVLCVMTGGDLSPTIIHMTHGWCIIAALTFDALSGLELQPTIVQAAHQHLDRVMTKC